MASLNEVNLIGNLGADPELRFTQSQVPVANFNIATTEHWTENNGEKKEHTEWHRVIVWQKLAESCAKYLTKGRQVMVKGKLQTRKWQDKEGKDRYTTEVVAHSVLFLGSNPNPNQSGEQPPAHGQAKPQQQQASAAPQGGGGQQPGLDDIPF